MTGRQESITMPGHHHGNESVLPVPALFQLSINHLKGLPGILLPLGVTFFNNRGSLLRGILFTWFANFLYTLSLR